MHRVSKDLRNKAREAAVLLARRGERVAVAETTAGGLLGWVLSVAEPAHAFAGSVVAYSAGAKEQVLGADPFAGLTGAVSPEMAAALAGAIRLAIPADWGVAETGIAGPQTGHRSAKGAGLGYVAVAGPTSQIREVRTGLDARAANQEAFAAAALDLLLEAIRLD